MSDNPLFFEKQKPSRKRMVEGEIFSIKINDKYVFGKVVCVDAQPQPEFSDAKLYLVYLYSGLSESAVCDLESLVVDNLLFAPVFTNHLGWSRGYFESTGQIDADPEHTLSQHAFRSFIDSSLCNEHGKPVTDQNIPEERFIGVQGIDSYLSIEDRLAKALNFDSV